MKITHISLLLALAVTAGCGSDGRTRPAQTGIQVFHAASNFDTLQLVRETRSVEANVAFARGSSAAFDSGQYEFTFRTLIAGVVPTNLYTFSANLDPGKVSTIVATSTGDQLEAFIVTSENAPPADGNIRYTVILADPSRGPTDVYFVAPGTPLDTVAPRGTMQYGNAPARFEVPEGTYQIFLTPAGDPASPYYESVDFDLAAGFVKTLVVYDPGGQSTADVDIADLINTGAARLLQVGVESHFRVVNAVDDRNENREIYLNEDTTPFFAAPLPYGEPTPSTVIPTGGYSVNLTPAGNPGTVESTTLLGPVPGLSYMTIFAGDTTDGIHPVSFFEDLRRISGQATVRVVHAASMFDTANIFIYPVGTDFTTVSPNVQYVRAPAVSDRLPFLPGDYQITVRNPTTATTIAGPEPITLEDGGVYGIMLVNSTDNQSVELKYIYDLAP